MKKFILVSVLWALMEICPAQAPACDIAVVSSEASATGRPFLWKNRDYSSSYREEIVYESAKANDVGPSLRVVGKVMHQTNIPLVSGGVNDRGFAIVNATVTESPLREIANVNHILLEYALEKCVSLDDFEALLDNWFNCYLFVVCGNFGVIDARGGAAMYEVWSDGTNRLFWEKYDANTAPQGFVVRANSHLTQGWVIREGGVTVRYERAQAIFEELVADQLLSPRPVLRKAGKDVAGDCDKFADSCDSCEKYLDGEGNSGPDPENFCTDDTLSRNTTTSSYVIDGALNASDLPFLTLYCALGEPSYTPVVPYFLLSGKVPYPARADYMNIFGWVYDLGVGCLLNDASTDILSRYDLYANNGVGLEIRDRTINYSRLTAVQEWMFPLEDFVLDQAEDFMADVRSHPELATSDNFYDFSYQCARYTYKNYAKGSSDTYPWEYTPPWEE